MCKLFGTFTLSVACCMTAGVDMLFFAKVETYQLVFFSGYVVSAPLSMLPGLLCAHDKRLCLLGMILLGTSLVMWSSVTTAAFVYSSHKQHVRMPFGLLEVLGSQRVRSVVLVFQTLPNTQLVRQLRKPEGA